MLYTQRRVTQFRAVCRHCKRQCPGWHATEYDAEQAARAHRWQRVLLSEVAGWLCGACLDKLFVEVAKAAEEDKP